jgi:hypothetical protein
MEFLVRYTRRLYNMGNEIAVRPVKWGGLLIK